MANLFGDFSDAAPSGDYTSDASVKTINDPRFQRDLRDYYEARGVQGSFPELFDRWKSDNRWREANIASTAVAAGRSYLQSEQQSEREARLARVWNALPNFYEQGGDGFVNAMKDYLPAALLDPTNLIPGGKALTAGKVAATKAAAVGESALARGLIAGAKDGAIAEGLMNAGVSGAQSYIEQKREVNLGMSDGVSLGRVATEAAAGGLMGAGIGGVIGGAAGLIGARGAGERAANLVGRGFDPTDVSNMSAAEIERLMANPTERAPALDAEPVNKTVSTDDPYTARPTPQENLTTLRSAMEREYDEARRRAQLETDPVRREKLLEVVEDHEDRLSRIDNLNTAPDRIEALRRSGEQMAANPSDPEGMAKGRDLQREAIQLAADYRNLMRSQNPDELTEFLDRLEAIDKKAEEPTPSAAATSQPANTPAQQPATPQPTAQPATQGATPTAAPATQAVSPTGEAPAAAPIGDPNTQAGKAAVEPAPTAEAAPAKPVQPAPEAAAPAVTADGTPSASPLDYIPQGYTGRPLDALVSLAPEQRSPAEQTYVDAFNRYVAAQETDQIRAAREARDAAQTAYLDATNKVTTAQGAGATPEQRTAFLQERKAAKVAFNKAKAAYDRIANPVRDRALASWNDAIGARAPEAPAPVERPKRSKPVREAALASGVHPDDLPPKATVADVERMAKEQKAPSAQLDADYTALETVLDEYIDLIPDEVVSRLNLFQDEEFISKLLSADPRTAPRFDQIFEIWQTARMAPPDMEMRVSPETVDKAMERRGRQLMGDWEKANPNASPEQRLARGREIAEELMRRRTEAPDDRPRADLPQQGNSLDRAAIMEGAGRGAPRREVRSDGSTQYRFGRIQSIIQYGRRTADDRSVVPVFARRETMAGRPRFVRPEGFIDAPRTSQFAYEEALLQGRASIEQAATQNRDIERKVDAIVRARRLKAAGEGATPAQLDALEAELRSNPDALVAQLAEREADAAVKRFADRVPEATPEKLAQVRATELERARKRLQPAQGMDVVRFVATGAEVYAGGRGRPKKGDAVFLDVISGFVYPDLRDVYLRRGMTPAQAADAAARAMTHTAGAEPAVMPANAYKVIEDAIAAFKQDGILEKLRGVLLKFKPQPNAPAVQPPVATPGLKGNDILVLIPLDGGPARQLSYKAAKAGATAESLLNSDENLGSFKQVWVNWKLSKAERDAKIADAMADVQPAKEVVEEVAAAPARPLTYSFEQAKTMRVEMEPAEAEAYDSAIALLSGGQKTVLPPAEGATLADVDLLVRALDAHGSGRRAAGAGWPKTLTELQQRVQLIGTLNTVVSRQAPNGVALDSLERGVALAQIERLASAYPAEAVSRMKRILGELTAERSAPLLGRSETGFSYSPAANAVRIAPDGLMPPEISLMHELAHWAYFQVLTPQDRTTFWGTLGKFYGADGKLDMAALQKATPGDGLITNSRVHPAEYFANAFVAFAQKRLLPEASEVGFWQKVGRYLQGIFDFFVGRKPVDADLVPIFSKILPEPERLKAASDVHMSPPKVDTKGAAAKLDAGVTAGDRPQIESERTADPAKMRQQIELNRALLGDLTTRWEQAIDTGNVDALIEVARETSSYLGSVFKSGPDGARTGAHWLFSYTNGGKRFDRWALGKHRASDINLIVGQNKRAKFDAEAPAGSTPITQPQRIFDQLRQLYQDGHLITPERDAAARVGQGAVFHGSRSPNEGEIARMRAGEDVSGKWSGTSLEYLLRVLMQNDVEGASARLDGRVASAARRAERRSNAAETAVAQEAAIRRGRKAAQAKDAQSEAASVAAEKAPAIQTKGATPYESRSIEELTALYQETKDPAAAKALVKKLRSKPEPVVPAGATAEQLAEVRKMRDLGGAYFDALDRGDRTRQALVAYEIQRRGAKTQLRGSAAQKVADVELQMRIEPSTENGIPSHAPAHLAEVLSHITMRSADDEIAARTLGLRILKLSSGMTNADAARIADVEAVAEHAAAPILTSTPEFKALRSQLRRLAASLAEGADDSTYDVVRGAARLVDRAIDASADIDSVMAHLAGDMPARELTKEALEVAEGVRYVLSGLVERQDLLSDYKPIAILGDVLQGAPAPLRAAFPDGVVPHALGADYAAELDRLGGEVRAANVRAFTTNGFGAGRVFYQDGASLSTSPAAFDATLRGMPIEKAEAAQAALAQYKDAVAATREALADGDFETAAHGAQQAAELRDLLAKEFDLAIPAGAPVYARVQSPARLDDGQLHVASDGFVSGLVRNLVEQGSLNEERAASLLASISPDGVTGTELRGLLAEALGDGADGRVRSALEAMGYDGIVTSRDDAFLVDVFGGRDAIRAVDDPSFDVGEIPTFQESRDLLGDTFQALADSDGKPATWSPMAEELAFRVGGDNVVTQAINLLGRNRKVDENDVKKLARASWATIGLGSNSKRLREVGGRHWLADFAEKVFPDQYQRLGTRLLDSKTGLLTQLGNLNPDRNGLKHWLRKASPFFMLGQGELPQPQNHAKILLALRQPSGSLHEKALSPRERAVYLQIRSAMQEEFVKLRDAGVMVGNRGPDYFPQVWSADAIRKNRDGFIQDMARYYDLESQKFGRPADPEAARRFAQDIYLTMSEEGADGTLLERNGTGRNPAADHLDYSRLIDLQSVPGAFDILSKYLEPDLEAMIVKYFDASTRRLLFTQKFGNGAHGFYDYQLVAINGRAGISNLLTSDKVSRHVSTAMSDAGIVDDLAISRLDFRAPFGDRPDQVAAFVDKLLATNASGGMPAVKEELLSLMRDPSGKVPAAWERRAEAIAAAIRDHGGEPAGLHPDEHVFEENLLRVLMRKPLSSNQHLLDASRWLRNFNSVTMLGFTLLASTSDAIMPLVRSGEFRSTLRAWQKYATDPDYRQLMAGTGVAIESAINERMAHLWGSGLSRFSQGFFWANGLTPWTDMMRKVGGAVGYESFKAMQSKASRYHRAGVPLPQQHPEFKRAYRFLKAYGLEDYATNNISLDSPDMLRQSRELRMAINQFTDQAVFSPNANDVPLWAQTPIGAIVFQLKSFPLMAGRLARDVLVDDVAAAYRAFREDGVRGLVANAPKRGAALLAVAPMFGAASLAMQDVARGRGGEENQQNALRNRNIGDWLGANSGAATSDENDLMGWYMESLMQAGGLGLLADLLHTSVANIDNGNYGYQRVLSTVLGPSVNVLHNAFDVTAGAANAAFGLKNGNDLERTAVRDIAGRVPILGGMVPLREGVVDALAGEADSAAHL